MNVISKNLNMKINKRDFLLFLLFIPYLSFHLTGKFGDSWNIIQFITAVVVLLLFFKKITFKAPSFYALLFGITIILFTYLGNRHELFFAVLYSLRLFTFILLFEQLIKREKATTIKYIIVYEGLIICINTIFQIVNPGFWGQNSKSGNYYNFLASDNELPYIYVGYIALLAAYSWHIKKRIERYVYALLVICTISIFVCKTGTGMVGMIVIWVAILLNLLNKNKFMTFRKVLIGALIVYLGVVVFRLHEYLAFFIENILHKDITLTTRTTLWDYALAYIRNNFFIGMGTMEGGRMLFIPTMSGQLYSSHSFFLEILVQGGIVGLILFIAIYICSGIAIKDLRGKTIFGFILACLISIMIMYISEGWIYQPLQYMLPVAIFWLGNGSKIEGKANIE